MKIDKQKANNILFIDIETATQYPTLVDAPQRMADLWLKKATQLKDGDKLSADQLYQERAAIFPEYGKIISIGLGGIFYGAAGDGPFLKIKCIHGHEEKRVLLEFKEVVERHSNSKTLSLCAHNGKGFDFLYIIRRMIINGIEPPECLKLQGKKPWEITHQDTMEMWRFGDMSFTSLDTLAMVFDLPSPKETMSGDQVSQYYHSTGDLKKISDYCKQDILAMVQVWLRINFFEPIEEQFISIL